MSPLATCLACLCLLLLVNWSEGAACPCQDTSLCDQVSTTYDKEVFIFSVKNTNWKKYDWSKVTTVAATYSDPELMCYAHSKEARIVPLVNFPVANLTNAADRSKWVAQQVQNCKDNFLDGVNVDFESAIGPDQTDLRDGLTALMKELLAAFRSNFKYSQLTFDPPSVPSLYGRYYDYASIGQLVDFIFMMDYDMNPSSQQAWANSPFNMTAFGIKEFLKLGIPAHKMVLGVPWYGYNYPCVSYTEADNVCHISEVPFRGVNCSDAAGSQLNYPDIVNTLLPVSTTGRLWDSVALSPYFSYKHHDTGQMYQVWYDDPLSLTLKYDLASRLELRGVGMWQADALDYSDSPRAREQTAMMWAALPHTRP